MNPKSTLFYCLLFLLSACNTQSAIEKIADKDLDAFSKKFIGEVIKGDSLFLSKIEASGSDTAAVMEIFGASDAMKYAKLESVKLIGYSKRIGTTDNNYWELSYEYKFNLFYANFYTKVVRRENEYVITSFKANMTNKSVLQQAEFSFKGKGMKHYFFFMLAILIPAFNIYTIVVAVKTRIRRKWLWIILIIMLNVPFYFNWSTGGVYWKNLTFQLIGLGIEQYSIYVPWMFAISIPFGSVIFWLKRRRIKKEEQEYEALIAMYQNNGEAQNADAQHQDENL